MPVGPARIRRRARRGRPRPRDFLALGTARWWLRDLTIAMGHADVPRRREPDPRGPRRRPGLAAGDRPAATNRLRAAFELLTQARERFYPVDAYLDRPLPARSRRRPPGRWPMPLEARAPVTFLAPARAIENLAERDPDRDRRAPRGDHRGLGRRRRRGRTTRRTSRSCPLESILWQFRQRRRRSTASTSTTATSRPSPGAGSASTRSCRRSPSGSGSGSRSTSASTPAGSRSGPRRSGSGRAPTARAWRR